MIIVEIGPKSRGSREMGNKKYTLEELLEIFEGHASEVDARIKRGENGGDKFNLPEAFCCIIRAVRDLEKRCCDGKCDYCGNRPESPREVQ